MKIIINVEKDIELCALEKRQIKAIFNIFGFRVKSIKMEE